MCTFGRERGCALRQLGPDGAELGRSELVPGICAQWVPRPEGGGVLITQLNNFRELAFTAVDAAGKRGASTSLTSRSGVYPSDARLASDGGLFAAVAFNGDLAYRGRRLGKTEFTVVGIVRFPPTLDRLAWSRLFGSRRTDIAALVPATQPGGIDAVLETRGPLVPGGPINPKVNPEDGSIYGGDTYGWRAERVAFDRRGKPGARQELFVGPKPSVYNATLVDGALAMLGRDPASWRRNMVTLLRSDGQREQLSLASAASGRFDASHGRTWVVAVEWTEVDGKYVGTWNAHEVGGARKKLPLAGTWGKQAVRWTSIAVRDDHVVALGTADDPATGTPVTFTALARLSSTAPAFDLARLALVDGLGLAPACRGPRAKFADQLARVHAADAALEACGVPPKARVELSTFPEGGLSAFSIKDGNAEVIACARRVVEPIYACPPESAGTSAFQLRP